MPTDEANGAESSSAGTSGKSQGQQTLKDLQDETAAKIGRVYGADVIHYNGPLTANHTDAFTNGIYQQVNPYQNPTKNVVLVLTTNGGDPHAAYRIARILQRLYDNVIQLVFGRCKSAGTLVAFGADQIRMGPMAQLGPLDMQTRKEDELVLQSSVLDIQQSLDAISGYAFRFYLLFVQQIVGSSGGAITTQTASEIASDMATDLLEPITDQIDPLRLGEDQRTMLVAKEYCKRLAPNRLDAIESLMQNYPSHGFVIDLEEAQNLLGDETVCEIDGLERKFEILYGDRVRNESRPVTGKYLYVHNPRDQSAQDNESDSGGTNRTAPPSAASEDIRAGSECGSDSTDENGGDSPEAADEERGEPEGSSSKESVENSSETDTETEETPTSES
jgi:hypothetical protein